MITINDVSVSKIDQHLVKLVESGMKDQSIKNKIHNYKKQGKYDEYLALKCAYEILKLNRELYDNEVQQ